MGIGILKLIVIMFVCINLVTIVVANVAVSKGNRFGEQIDNSFILKFFIVKQDTDFGDFGGKGLELNETFKSAIQNATTPQSSGTSILPTTSVTLFLDALKMIIGFIAMLTPLPFIAFVLSLGPPILVNVLFVIPIFMLWIMGLIEFIRGANMP